MEIYTFLAYILGVATLMCLGCLVHLVKEGENRRATVKMGLCTAAFIIATSLAVYMASVSEPLDTPIGVEIPESGAEL